MGQIVDRFAARGLFEGAHCHNDVVYAEVYPKENLEKCRTFQFRDPDVLLAEYPKSGEYILLLITSLKTYCYSLRLDSHYYLMLLTSHETIQVRLHTLSHARIKVMSFWMCKLYKCDER